MVQRLFTFMYTEIRGLHQAAYILALFTFGSQLLALIRDRLLAHTFGAGTELDLYYTAFRIPDFFYVLFVSMLSVYVLIPFLSERLAKYNEKGAQQFLSQIFSLFILGYSAVAILVIVFAPQIVAYFFPGFAEQSNELVPMIRILMLQPLLLGVSSLFGVITQMYHRYVLYALCPLAYNVGIIVGIVYFFPMFGLVGLAYGVLFGALLHLCIQLPFVSKHALMPSFTIHFSRSDMLAVCKTSTIRALTLSLHQFVLLGLVGFASIMAAGSVSVFQFSLNLQSVPLAIIGVSYSVAAFPLLTQLYTEKKYQEFGLRILNTLKHIIFWSIPVIALFIVLRAQFVRVVLGSGAFDWSDTRLTAAILAICILSLTAQAVHLLLVRALYATGNTRLPFWVTFFSSWLALLLAYCFYMLLLLNTGVQQFFSSLMRLDGVSGIEVLALPLGYSAALIVHTLILVVLSRRSLYFSLRSILVPFIQSIVAGIVCGYSAYIVLDVLAPFLPHTTVFALLAQGLIAGVIGLMAYIFVLYLCKSETLREVWITISRRFGKGDILVPQGEDQLSV